MYSRETRVLLRHYLEQGVGKAELARKLGVSRRTAYHCIETAQLDRDLDDETVRYSPRPPVPTKLDPFKGIVQERPQAFPRLTAQCVLEEVRAAGYGGGYTQLKQYIRQVRPRPKARYIGPSERLPHSAAPSLKWHQPIIWTIRDRASVKV